MSYFELLFKTSFNDRIVNTSLKGTIVFIFVIYFELDINIANSMYGFLGVSFSYSSLLIMPGCQLIIMSINFFILIRRYGDVTASSNDFLNIKQYFFRTYTLKNYMTGKKVKRKIPSALIYIIFFVALLMSIISFYDFVINRLVSFSEIDGDSLSIRSEYRILGLMYGTFLICIIPLYVYISINVLISNILKK